jgi:Xaa-Pro aminopeptidase
MHVALVQAELARLDVDGWLVADFRGSNPLFADLAGVRGPLTRRAALWIPRRGATALLGSAVDGHTLATSGHAVQQYGGLADLQKRLRALLRDCRVIALEYTPDGANPVISRVDAGFVDWLRAGGLRVVSSGELISLLVRWDAGQVADHRAAAGVVDRVRAFVYAEAFARAGTSHPATEHELAELILGEFAAAGLVAGAADVAVNAHAADPHYAASAERPVPVREGDALLVDLWARLPGKRSPFADSTWMGFAGAEPPAALSRAFDAVRAARDAGLALLEGAWREGRALRGREVDRHVRDLLATRGYAAQFIHRTGHSLGWHHIHGDGPNLDDFEFPDDRLLRPVSGVTVEPGVYLPGEFGVRLEVSVLLSERGPEVTTALQERLEQP